jgi:hypothetical protein
MHFFGRHLSVYTPHGVQQKQQNENINSITKIAKVIWMAPFVVLSVLNCSLMAGSWYSAS